MQFRLLAVSLLATVSLAAAWATTTVTVTTYPPQPTPPPASQCNTGELYCCNSSNLAAANSGLIGPLLEILQVAVEPVTAIVGTACSPIDVLSIGSGSSCTAQPVCCQNNHYEGLVVIGCSPVNINL
ncbi:fungal hydrophobin-domain-containing protein [Crepidotus variabilis]|uniref:Hydrophobin n=1 Tax=Crepidotus variabilis TaxID=179855 RepID=A0A9P6JI37_9AGAR|nr:fungal hydrophobin-domain-containing protein [Crepidotus variabilis]